jgi:hypothetical protein
MSKRGVGLLLILTAAIALGALVQDVRFDRLIAAEQTAVSTFNQRARDLEHQIDALDGSRRVAMAGGQTPGDWIDRAAAAIDTAENALGAVRTSITDAPTIAALDAAGAAFEKFKRAESNSVAQSAVQDVHDGLSKAMTAHRDRENTSLGQIQMVRLAMNGVALIFTLAVAVYLGRVATVLGVKAPPSMAQMLRDLPPPVKTGATNGASIAPAPAPAAAAPLAPPLPPASASTHRPSANLAAAAELCVDLAKVLDADDVPVLLERAALVLDARGIVLWGIDSDGVRLQPSLSYGYPDKVLARLRPLQIDADNVTSLAFRSAQPQMMTGASTTDPAALAIPLLTGGGCVGIMAVELRHNRPHADLLPVARILSAQFSTLMTPAEDTLTRAAR